MKEPQELYLELYKEYRSEIRHQESQRAAVSTICVGLAAGLIGLNFQEKERAAGPYLGVLLMNFSLVAYFILRKLYERFAIGRERAKLYLDEVDRSTTYTLVTKVDEVSPNSRSLRHLWILGRQNHERDHEFWSFVRLHDLWASLLIGSFIVGLLFSASPLLPHRFPNWLPVALGSIGTLLQIVVIRHHQSDERRKELLRRVRSEMHIKPARHTH